MAHLDSVFEHKIAQHAVVATATPRRLIVFIHGWRGDAWSTWGEFGRPPAEDWWAESDLLFVNYDSTSESVVATADRIRARIGDFYPLPNRSMLERDGYLARADITSPYHELILVGHSLGGLVARRALVDALEEWRTDHFSDDLRPAILDAKLRLFSPASAGFQPRGALGALKAAPLWWVAEIFLSRGGAYLDLLPGSDTLISTRLRTERWGVNDARAASLAAEILWANPEKVVATEKYDTDARTRTIDRTDHGSVCKPSMTYDHPYRFVRTGRIDADS